MTFRHVGPLAILIAGLLALSAAAQADAVHYAADTTLLDQILSGMEIDYEITWDDAGKPVWTFTRSGILLTVEAYDETSQGQYASLLFYAGWAVEGEISLSGINHWNRTSRFGRAYVDEMGDPAIELDLLMSGGVAAQTIQEYIDVFVATVSDLGVALGL